MAGTFQFTIGAEASCSDGTCGEVTRVIVDPVAEAVTHLVVEPEHRRGLGKLVPLGLIDATAGRIRLHCTQAEFDKLEPAEETQFIPGTSGYADYGPGQVGYWPYYGLSMGGGGMGGGGMNGGGIGGGGIGGGGMSGGLSGFGGGNISQTVTYDTVPQGEVDVRRGEHVQATDGDIGRVQGLVIDRRSRHVTHVLLQEGHLWGRREVAIPISAVASTSDGIRLRISKQEVQDLPPVDVDHPGASTADGGNE
jgi:sporulation protein YlmC with PRC-barrel domain